MAEEQFMKRAIELAKQGVGWTAPNPLVGAVVVKNGRVIGEGYHRKYGELHAERNALAACTEDPAGATLYVTLEPCCHYGKTPPCTEIIIEKKIAKVVIGSRDPNPKVAGKGARILREHGINVVEDYMREACDALNPVFFHYITTKTPYVVLKFAMTLDGKIATRTGASKWITGEAARNHVHQLRGRYAGILAGIGTVLADDPMLNCRIDGAHQPLRIILDSHLRIPMGSRLVRSAKEYPLLIVCNESTRDREEGTNRIQKLEEAGAKVWTLPEKNGHPDLNVLMQRLGEEKIDSVLIEGGGTVNEAVLKAHIVHHVYAYIAPKIFGGEDAKTPVEGSGIRLPQECAKLRLAKITVLLNDMLLEYDVEGETECSPE
ncbi:MAG: bifunctional diaminohydroxyphosphoribosylaminopyrimidine deaminase/5-amino-6-(5-phosphoribosylamino)uracil reductase RibD [Clostridia bacterium]|uniref:Riboflavin biosynthesis protein RibD n=1 Tax=Mogibacterium kristiansenii TaxID=2606708 RepID=A0A6N7X959_9FIRM|nr:bifunctional diaminohydroxyphosphoribosylaminopyrimidine deaminase/5-amino-6-(5-phosphoribosylamino)uracil reductase RibD [Mogibacterium kristiansenii]MDD6700763.1 bifunctional diaminohydroxyphosphoribosylaminopyrimidine deaminase/5-amino-6-(5-phosphoribosylamino)uracil reductase RibD [Mogibacterium kristiansenii]MDY5450726.1 bifunctional diaminohydroxyphosphoribosylaminopyrimidine deaminase/5-amino-6-(5-phosphoribosylamino)uracil reductase RibD [Clostridia bacterium]MST71083.1 bifunctional d